MSLLGAQLGTDAAVEYLARLSRRLKWFDKLGLIDFVAANTMRDNTLG